jgi:hypothetical protein
MAVDDSLTDLPAAARGVPGGYDGRRKGENDGHGRDAGSCSARHELAAGSSLDVGGIDDDEPAGSEPSTQLAMEDLEGQPCRSLIRGVPRDRLAVGVG